MLTGISVAMSRLNTAKLQFVSVQEMTKIGKYIWEASKLRTQRNHCGIRLNNTYAPYPPYSPSYARRRGKTKVNLTLSGAMWSPRSMGLKVTSTGRQMMVETYFKGSLAIGRLSARQVAKLRAEAKTDRNIEARLSEKWSPAGKAGAYVKKHEIYILGATPGEIRKIKGMAETAMQMEISRIQRFDEVKIA